MGKSIFLMPGEFPGDNGDNVKTDFTNKRAPALGQPMAGSSLYPLLLTRGDGLKGLIYTGSPLDLHESQTCAPGSNQVDLPHWRLVAAFQYPIAVGHEIERCNHFSPITRPIGLFAFLAHFEAI